MISKICFHLHIIVAPLVGAWIEIFEACEKSKRHGVAPLVGAWIEICDDVDEAALS